MTSPLNETPFHTASDRRSAKVSTLILIVLVLLTFGRLCGSEFTEWDDQATIYKNYHLNPPTFATLVHYFKTPELGLYIPVTYTVWAVVAKIAYVGRPDDFGIFLNPWPFHTVNVLVHLATAFLVLQWLRRILHSEWPALFGALVFALHPLQVETVGWVSGLKDLLCWFFGIASLLLYTRRVQSTAGSEPQPPLWKSWEMPASLGLLILALLSKPAAVVIPAAILAVDGLLLRRRWVRPVVEALPLLLVASIAAIVGRSAQYVWHVHSAAIWQRPFIVGDTLTFDLMKFAWPAVLAIDYGHSPTAVMSWPITYVTWIFPAVLAVAVWRVRRRFPVVAVGTLLFLIGIAPVSGVATFEMQNYSTVTDHYLYFSILGPALIVGWILCRWPTPLLRWTTAVVVAVIAIRSFVQAGVWHDSFTLFTHCARANPRSSVAPGNLAVVYISQSPPRPDLAEPYADAAYAVDSENVIVLNAYASTKALLGKRDDALRAWEKSYEIMKSNPAGAQRRPGFMVEVAEQLLDLHEPERALRWAQEAAEIDPNLPHLYPTLLQAKADIAAKAATLQTTTTAPSLPPATMPASEGGRG